MISLKDYTLSFRHGIVQVIAPKLYATYKRLDPYTSYPRPMILYCYYRFNRELVTGLEIGVGSGGNALNIAKLLNLKMLYLIDPYETYYDHNIEITQYQRYRLSALKQIDQNIENYHFIHKPSELAIDDIPEDLDFIYIDGNHSPENVKQDIELYYPKVRPGGVFGGHDFQMNFIGVVRAVTDLICKTKKRLYGSLFDWWIIK